MEYHVAHGRHANQEGADQLPTVGWRQLIRNTVVQVLCLNKQGNDNYHEGSRHPNPAIVKINRLAKHLIHGQPALRSDKDSLTHIAKRKFKPGRCTSLIDLLHGAEAKVLAPIRPTWPRRITVLTHWRRIGSIAKGQDGRRRIAVGWQIAIGTRANGYSWRWYTRNARLHITDAPVGTAAVGERKRCLVDAAVDAGVVRTRHIHGVQRVAKAHWRRSRLGLSVVKSPRFLVMCDKRSVERVEKCGRVFSKGLRLGLKGS